MALNPNPDPKIRADRGAATADVGRLPTRRGARARQFIVPSLCTVFFLSVLLSLGTWQVYRLHWKEAILARIAAAEAMPPVALGTDPQAFAKVDATGHFRFDRVAQFGAEVRDTISGPTMGFHQIVPLERDGAPTVLVDRGWMPQKRLTALNDPDGAVTVSGYIRRPEKQHWFSPPDDMATRQFYTLDPRTIGAAINVANPAPFILVALGPPTPGSYPEPAQHLPRPPNNHLSYAITWYGLAIALVVIFTIWAKRTLGSS